MSIVDEKTEQVGGLCREHGVKGSYVFGSALRDAFGPDSDIDLGIVFARDGIAGSFDQDSDFKSAWEQLLERPVDLVCLASVRNRILRREIDETKRLLCAA